MSEHESDKQSSAVPGTSAEAVNQPAAETSHAPVATAPQTKSKTGLYIAAIVIVVATLFIVFFMLEKEGRSSTGFFDAYFAAQEDSTVVARVNGEEITGKDLQTSIEQFNQAAVAQGIDTTSAEVIADIRSQALEVLVNTTLLKQAAEAEGMAVTDQEVDERLQAIETDIGGADQLQARIAELGLTRADLREDIEEEILIQGLLDDIFAAAEIAVTEEEIQTVYDAAGGVEAGLPPLEEVRDQVAAQVRSTKEQEAIDNYLQSQKTEADIELI